MRRTRDIKELIERKLEEYDTAMVQDLLDLAAEELDGISIEDLDEDVWVGIFQSWTTKDPQQWAEDEVESDYDTHCDQLYEEYKDARSEEHY